MPEGGRVGKAVIWAGAANGNKVRLAASRLPIWR